MRVKTVICIATGMLIITLVGALVVFLDRGRLIPSVGDSGTQANRRPSVILITVDTLRADHLSCYGYPRKTSPNIDQFAQDALLFENCLSHAPMTRPSCASILSGFLPHETKVFESPPCRLEWRRFLRFCSGKDIKPQQW